MKEKRNLIRIAFVLLAAFLACDAPLYSAASELPEKTINGIVNLSFPEEGRDLQVPISSIRSKAYHWAPGRTLSVKAFVGHPNGKEEALKDRFGKGVWEVTLDAEGQGLVKISFDEKAFSGKLIIRAEGKELFEPTEEGGSGPTLEKVHEYRFNDGARLKVHFTDQTLETYGAEADLGSQVMDAAVMAYQTITSFEGFSTPGYSFASPDRNYAYDPDSTIDIYLGSPNGDNDFTELGARNRMFRDAPCFDTIQLSSKEYQAVILLPANYRDFIKGWEKINPSPMGKRNIHVDLRGTLIHEMLHTIIFYYNKNLNKSEQVERAEAEGLADSPSKNLDWYVEGLARYFETFAGARHDFYSQGFKQLLPDKIRFSRGGSNYFMRYPDQPFTRLRYENALFWRFLDHRYGMASIEALSREFRKENADFKSTLEKVTGAPFERLLTDYALAVLEKDFGLKEDAAFLDDIARTRLDYHDGGFYLLDGSGGQRPLDKSCATDWIGRWGDASAAFGEPSVAGDSTDAADVSGWATDFYELTFGGDAPVLPKFRMLHEGDGEPLFLQVLCISKGGSVLKQDSGPISRRRAWTVDLPDFVAKNGLQASDIEKVYLLVTNTDPERTAPYEFRLED